MGFAVMRTVTRYRPAIGASHAVLNLDLCRLMLIYPLCFDRLKLVLLPGLFNQCRGREDESEERRNQLVPSLFPADYRLSVAAIRLHIYAVNEKRIPKNIIAINDSGL